MKTYPKCNSICTDNNEVEVGKKYQYYESMPLVICDVKVIEDNSDEKYVSLKLKVLKYIAGIKLKKGYEFSVSMINEPGAFSGMWRLYPEGGAGRRGAGRRCRYEAG